MYMDASEKLQHAAMKNLNDIIKVGVPEHVYVFACLHVGDSYAWLYRLEGKHMSLVDQVELDEDPSVSIISTARRLFTEYPTKKHGLVLWNHGFGILVPYYCASTNTWDVEPDGDELCLECSDLTTMPHLPKQTMRRRRSVPSEHTAHKGMMINAYTNTVMDNDQFVRTVKTIHEDVLRGKKIDFVGLDSCLGSMLEHGYQLKDHVDYLIGSQDCEMVDGWDYSALMRFLSQGSCDSREIVKSIVENFGAYYAPRAPVGRYTQSALDLNCIDALKNNHDQITALLCDMLNQDGKEFGALLRYVRSHCIRFCIMPSYTDIDDFYATLLQGIEKYESVHGAITILGQLKEVLEKGRELVSHVVVANATGPVNAVARGISIYFPRYHIDSSYPFCLFAQESIWLSFLADFVVL